MYALTILRNGTILAVRSQNIARFGQRKLLGRFSRPAGLVSHQNGDGGNKGGCGITVILDYLVLDVLFYTGFAEYLCDQRVTHCSACFFLYDRILLEVGCNSKDIIMMSKIRRAYAIGGCLVFMWLSTHGLLLYRRRYEHRYLNEKNPAIPWDDFVEDYLMPGLVKTIIYQPQFGTGNVFLHSTTEKSINKVILNKMHFAPGKFSRPPDLRFSFGGDSIAFHEAIQDLRQATSSSSTPVRPVEFRIDEFPNHWEMAFIAISTLLTIVAITFTK